MFGVIGGTGLKQLAGMEILQRRVVRTPYGEPSGALWLARLGQSELWFLARHGHGHTLPPHTINYRANLWALREVGVHEVLAVSTVTGLAADLKSGDLVLPDQIVDYTWGREHTFFEGRGSPVSHVDFTQPYSSSLRVRLLQSAAQLGFGLRDGGCYGCTQGPRSPTAAELRRCCQDGCDWVGMTGMPEAALARELDLSYAALCAVATLSSQTSEQTDQVRAAAELALSRIQELIAHAVQPQ